MKKFTALLVSFVIATGLASPALSETTQWTSYQKTLATYSGNKTGLSNLQKSQIKATLEKTPLAEKFICTGIRYYDQAMSVNIMVRKRAKEACAYAKQLNPELSTWFQNKPTEARSYAGKVLLTVKSPLTEQTPEKATGIPAFRGAIEPPRFLHPVVGDQASFSPGVWPSGWRISDTHFLACRHRNLVSYQDPEGCENLDAQFVSGESMPDRLVGRYLHANLTLIYKDIASSQRTYSVGGPQVRESPMWGRLPKLSGSRFVGEVVSLDIGTEQGYAPAGYQVDLQSAIWSCGANSPEDAISNFDSILESGGCDWLGNLYGQPIVISDAAQGKYLVGQAIIQSTRTGASYSQTTWIAWEVLARNNSLPLPQPVPVPDPAPSPEPAPEPAPSPETGPEPQLRYIKYQFSDGYGYCSNEKPGSKFVSGRAIVPSPDWRGLGTEVRESSFTQEFSGGYSSNGSLEYWARAAVYSPWRNVTRERYGVESIPWRAPIEITCSHIE